MIKLMERISRIAGRGMVRDNYLFLERKSKRGFILGEFNLKLIIAIVSILILLYLLFNIYSTFSSKSKIAQADASLNKVVEGIMLVENSGSEYHYVLTEPKGWPLLYFGASDLRPKACQNKECLCICEKPGIFSFSSQVEKCDDLGVCKATSRKVSVEPELIINPTEIVIKRQDVVFSIGRVQGENK